MKKIIFLFLVLIMFNSLQSIAKYSTVIEYNFLTVNILVIENKNNVTNTLHKPFSTINSNTNNYYLTNSINQNINSDIFIDTNTNIQIQITK